MRNFNNRIFYLPTTGVNVLGVTGTAKNKQSNA